MRCVRPPSTTRVRGATQKFVCAYQPTLSCSPRRREKGAPVLAGPDALSVS